MLNTDECKQKAQFYDSDAILQVPGNGDWSGSSTNWGTGQYQTKLWFAAASDCESQTHVKFPSMPRLEVEVTMMNDSSHFSQEDMGILPFYIIMFVLFVVFLGKTIMEIYRDVKKEDTFENPLIAVLTSLIADLFSIGFMALHLFFLSFDGSGIYVLSIFSRLFKTISQAMMIWLLITISYGWTVTYRNAQETDIYVL